MTTEIRQPAETRQPAPLGYLTLHPAEPEGPAHPQKRQHAARNMSPAQPGSDHVLLSLCREWGVWRARKVPGSWRLGCPALALATTLDDAMSLACDDEVAQFLLCAAQGGDQAAARLLTQALLPRLGAQAQRDGRHELGDYVSTMWELIHRFPIERRHHAVATNLVLDCRKQLTRADGHELVWGDPPEPPTPPVTTNRRQAAVIIDLATRRGYLTGPNAAVVRSVYVDGLSGREAAGRHAISEDLVRYRCSSSLRRLRAHVDELRAA